MKLQTFGFIGLGLIGGSLAMALRRAIPDCRIIAYIRSQPTSEAALSSGTIDAVCASPSDLQFAQCDCIFLCTPVGSNIEALHPA